MMKKLLLLVLICAGFQSLSAQQKVAAKDETSTKAAISEERKAMLKERLESQSKGKIDPESLISVTDVGEPDSFGKTAKFLGTATSGIVYVYYSCDPAVLLADIGLVLETD